MKRYVVLYRVQSILLKEFETKEAMLKWIVDTENIVTVMAVWCES